MGDYSDIRNCRRPPPAHGRMKRGDRAKLFAPFDALSGFGSAIREKDRVLTPRCTLAEDEQEALDRRLRRLTPGDLAAVTYFVPVSVGPDGEEGEYRTAAERVVRLDTDAHMLILENTRMPIEDIAALRTGTPHIGREA